MKLDRLERIAQRVRFLKDLNRCRARGPSGVVSTKTPDRAIVSRYD